jgi:hypothetical protein
LTHTNLPAHTNGVDGDAQPDMFNYNLRDQLENWSNVFPEWALELLPCALEIVPYEGTRGHGWFLTVWVRHNGITYHKTWNSGPESSNAHDWRVHTEP